MKNIVCPFCGKECHYPEEYGGRIYECDCDAIYAVDDSCDLHETRAEMNEYLIGNTKIPRVEFREVRNFDKLSPPVDVGEVIPEEITLEKYFDPDAVSEQVLVWAKIVQ